jgi:outer membrane protein assembly factor BamD
MPEQSNEILEILKLNYADYPALNKNGEFDFNYMYNNGNSPWLAYLTLGLFSKNEITGFDTREIYDPQFKVATDVARAD